mgnify:FL=1
MPFSDLSISYQNETEKRTRVRARFYEGEWVLGEDGWRFDRTLLDSRTTEFPAGTDQAVIDARLLEILGELSPHPLVGDAPD